MTDERQPGAQEHDRAVDGPAALGEVFHLQEQLAARGSRVRQDAERALGRAAALRADGDPRAGIAVSACRETLGAYQEAVDRSVRQACDAAGPATADFATADSAAATSAASPSRSSARSSVGVSALGPAPSTGTAIRHKVARLLAAAAVTGVLGLVGWGGLPSWSTVTATSPGQPSQPLAPVVADAADGPDAPDAPELAAGAGRAPRPEGRAGPVERSAGRPAPADRQHDDVRGVIASTLPGPVELSPSVAIVANGLRAVGEAAASLATTGETPSSDGPSDDAAEAARSLLPDGVDAVDEAVDAAGDGAAGVDDLEDGELPDTRSPEEAGDADGLDGVTEGRELWDGDEASGEPEDRAPAEDGVSEDAELDR